MQQTDSDAHTHKYTQEDSHTVTPHLNNLPHSSWSISCSDTKKIRPIDGGKRKRGREEEREGGREAAVMICDAFTTATCSILIHQNPDAC